jgi:uncharacterized protein YcaQ
MPLLWDDAVIGWVNVARSAGGIDVQAGYINGRPTETGFDAAFDAEVARMQRFLAADEPSGQQ